MGKMDIAEKRVPQDGRIEISIDTKLVDLRISVLPTVFGEKIVIRLLDRSSFLLSKSQLGFTDDNLSRFDKLIENPNGIILITGPTGSGKTTTLYTILRELNKINKNIITVEDPVEYKLHGINQVQVNNKAGLTFANGLRSILRQDPDIVMIGEIRDSETAQIAARAAITGHLVISTMHTNDAPSTITRLMDMGIQPYLISASVVGAIAQRLVRKICTSCKEEYIPSEKEKEVLNIGEDTKLYKGKGCPKCYNTGYKGRTSIHEIMNISKGIRESIDNEESIDRLRTTAIDEGMITLRQNCKELLLDGTTSFEEFITVT
jgi:type IV pilus assembly protein PilB